MKKVISILSVIILTSLVSAAEYPLIKIAEYENKKELNSISIRKAEEVDISDDVTGNILSISKDGTMIIHCRDLDKLLKIESSLELKYYMGIKDVVNSDANHIETIYDEKYLFSGSWADYLMIDKKGNKIFSFNSLADYNIRMSSIQSYFLEDANVLFFWDNKENIYSVVNPGMNKEENRKNFHNTEETKKLFESDVEINGVKVRVTSSNNVFINDTMYFWKQKELGNYRYQTVSKDYFMIYNKNNIKEKYRIKFPDETEIIESSALHPSGDIYILRMNWNTNTHNLYRIENTWDPQWRAQWYKGHPDAN